MKISAFQAILYGVFGVSALIGLFVFATYTAKNGANAIGPVVIWGTLPKESMEATLIELNKIEVSLKNVSYGEKDPRAPPADLAAAIATGGAPDLVLASQENLLALAKFVAPISLSTLPTSAFVNTFVGEGSLFAIPGGAGYWGIPFLIDPLVLFSNHAILASLGIAKPPDTWEALTGLVPSVATLTSTRQITRALIALGTYDNVNHARGILSTLFLQIGVPISTYSAGVFAADLGRTAENGVPPGRAVLSFYTQFADPSKVSYTWDPSLPDSEKMFLTGDLALYIGYASRARYLKAANPNLDIGTTPIPQPATTKARSVYGLAYAFMIPRGAGNAAGAYQTATLLIEPRNQAVAAKTTGLAPATLTTLAVVPSDDPAAAVAYAEALYTKGWLSPSPLSTDQIFSRMIGNVVSGRSSFDTALNSAGQSLGALLQQK